MVTTDGTPGQESKYVRPAIAAALRDRPPLSSVDPLRTHLLLWLWEIVDIAYDPEQTERMVGLIQRLAAAGDAAYDFGVAQQIQRLRVRSHDNLDAFEKAVRLWESRRPGTPPVPAGP